MKNKAKQVAKQAHRVDRKLSRKAAKARDHGVVRLAARIGELADQPPLAALSVATVAAGLILRQPAIARAGARMLASHLVGIAIKTAIKRSIDRTRPHAAEDGKRYKLERGASRHHDYSSFPSGHTVGAVAAARAVTREAPDSTPAAIAAAGAVGVVQLPSAKHYATDVAAGVAVGLVSEWLVDRAFDLLERRLKQARVY